MCANLLFLNNNNDNNNNNNDDDDDDDNNNNNNKWSIGNSDAGKLKWIKQSGVIRLFIPANQSQDQPTANIAMFLKTSISLFLVRFP